MQDRVRAVSRLAYPVPVSFLTPDGSLLTLEQALMIPLLADLYAKKQSER